MKNTQIFTVFKVQYNNHKRIKQHILRQRAGIHLVSMISLPLYLHSKGNVNSHLTLLLDRSRLW
jgi:hypothetical protein